MTNSGPVPFVPWGTTQGSREEVKTKHNEKALTFHEAIGSRGKRRGHQVSRFVKDVKNDEFESFQWGSLLKRNGPKLVVCS